MITQSMASYEGSLFSLNYIMGSQRTSRGSKTRQNGRGKGARGRDEYLRKDFSPKVVKMADVAQGKGTLLLVCFSDLCNQRAYIPNDITTF